MDFHAASLTGNSPAERHPSAFNEAAPVLYRNTILRHLSTELVIGVSAFMGVRRSLNRIYMQMPGTGYVSKIVDAQAEPWRRVSTACPAVCPDAADPGDPVCRVQCEARHQPAAGTVAAALRRPRRNGGARAAAGLSCHHARGMTYLRFGSGWCGSSGKACWSTFATASVCSISTHSSGNMRVLCDSERSLQQLRSLRHWIFCLGHLRRCARQQSFRDFARSPK